MRKAGPWALLLLAACASGNDAPDADWKGTREPLVGGGVLVENPEGALWRPEQQWVVEETGRIGALEGDDAYVFGEIVGMAMDGDGAVFAFDGQAHELRAFSADGTLLRRFGREGAGPGEFRHVTGITLAPGGSVWVIDPANSRYTVVDPDGSYRMVPRDAGPWRTSWLGGFTTTGDLVDSVTRATNSTYDDVLVLIDSTGRVSDTIPLPGFDLPVPRLGRMEFPLPFAVQALRAFDPAGYAWSAHAGDYRFLRTSFEGDTTMIVTGAAAPPALSPAERDSITRYVRMLSSDVGLNVADDVIPASAPIIRWLAVDDLGYLWVGRNNRDDEVADVFDSQGRGLGRVVLPFRVGALPPVIRGTKMLALSETELGAPVLIQAEILGR